jgi:hypothetical protein
MRIDWNDLPAWFVLGCIGLILAVAVVIVAIQEHRAGRLPRAGDVTVFPFGGEPSEEGCLFTGFLGLFCGGFLYARQEFAWWLALPAGIALGVLLHVSLALLALVYFRIVVIVIEKASKGKRQ